MSFHGSKLFYFNECKFLLIVGKQYLKICLQMYITLLLFYCYQFKISKKNLLIIKYRNLELQAQIKLFSPKRRKNVARKAINISERKIAKTIAEYSAHILQIVKFCGRYCAFSAYVGTEMHFHVWSSRFF